MFTFAFCSVGIWQRILYHECDYLKTLPFRELEQVANLRSAQRYFDYITNSGYGSTVAELLPTPQPVSAPTEPTSPPTKIPTKEPTKTPTTKEPTAAPISPPTTTPQGQLTKEPTHPTEAPVTEAPTTAAPSIFLKEEFSSNEFLTSYPTKKGDYQFKSEWVKGFGCCATTLSAETYPSFWDYGYLLFRMEWPYSEELPDLIWAHDKLPTEMIREEFAPMLRGRYEDQDALPEYKIPKDFTGLARCDTQVEGDLPENTCVFSDVNAGFEIGVLNLRMDPKSAEYEAKKGECLVASGSPASAAALWIKNYNGLCQAF